jgi:hypothetical protein
MSIGFIGRAKRQLALTALSLLAVIGMTSKQVRTQRNMSRSKYVPHQGARECARRRRQMESGMLRAANGVELL